MSNASMLNVCRSKKWYEGPNVCIERKVIQDGDEVEEGNVLNQINYKTYIGVL